MGLLVGGLFAAFAFAISAFSIPVPSARPSGPRLAKTTQNLRPMPAAALSPSPESKEKPMSDWLPSLVTATPAEGFDLAVKLSRAAVRMTQPDAAARDRLRTVYAEDADALIAASQVVAIHFATIAAANGYWRGGA
jgi:hypothetical protein